MFSRLIAALPTGGTLSPQQWAARHRMLQIVLLLHLIALTIAGLFLSKSIGHLAFEVLPIVGAWVIATREKLSPQTRSVVLALGLLICSALLIHLVNGTTEAHFHFFVVLPLVALYQRWSPLLISLAFVVVHHFGMAVTVPEMLFDTEIAIANPIWFVVIHSVFVALAVTVLVAFWKLAEDAVLETAAINRARAQESERQLAHRTQVQTQASEQIVSLSAASQRGE